MTAQTWDFNDNVSYGPWETQASQTIKIPRAGAGIFLPNDEQPYYLGSYNWTAASGTVDLFDTTQEEANSQVSALMNSLLTQMHSSPPQDTIQWLYDQRGTTGLFDLNGPYYTGWHAVVTSHTESTAAFLRMPSPYGPEGLPPNAVAWQYEKNEWTLESAVLEYKVFARANSEYESDMTATVGWRATCNPALVQQNIASLASYTSVVQGAPPPHDVGALDPVDWSAYDVDLGSVSVSTVGKERRIVDEGFNTYDPIGRDVGFVSGTIDLTSLMPSEAVPRVVNNSGGGYGFDVMVRSQPLSINVRTVMGGVVGGRAGSSLQWGSEGDVFAGPFEGEGEKIATHFTVTYVVRPPRKRFVYINETPGDGIAPLPMTDPGALTKVYGSAAGYQTGDDGGRFFMWTPESGMAFVKPPEGRSTGPLARLPDGRLVCYDVGLDYPGPDSGVDISLGYIMDENLQLLETLPGYPVNDNSGLDQGGGEANDIYYGMLFYRPETQRMWMASYVYHYVEYSGYPRPGDRFSFNNRLPTTNTYAYALHELTVDGTADLSHHVLAQKHDDQFNDKDNISYGGGKFWWGSYDKVLHRFDPETGIWSFGWTGLDIEKVFGMSLDGHLILLSYQSGYKLRSINPDDVTWYEAKFNFFPQIYNDPIIPYTDITDLSPNSDVPDYAWNETDWGMLGNKVYWSTYRLPTPNPDDSGYGLVEYDLDTHQWRQVFMMPEFLETQIVPGNVYAQASDVAFSAQSVGLDTTSAGLAFEYGGGQMTKAGGVDPGKLVVPLSLSTTIDPATAQLDTLGFQIYFSSQTGGARINMELYDSSTWTSLGATGTQVAGSEFAMTHTSTWGSNVFAAAAAGHLAAVLSMSSPIDATAHIYFYGQFTADTTQGVFSDAPYSLVLVAGDVVVVPPVPFGPNLLGNLLDTGQRFL